MIFYKRKIYHDRFLHVVHILHSFGTGGMENDLATIINNGSQKFKHTIVCLTKSGAMVPAFLRKPIFGTIDRLYPKADYLPQIFRGKAFISNVVRDPVDAYFFLFLRYMRL